MATAATILLGSTVDVFGCPCDFEAVALATLTIEPVTRWTVVGLGGEFLDLDGPASLAACPGGNLLIHGLLALLVTNEQTYAATRGALRAAYGRVGYPRTTDAQAVSLGLLAAEIPRDWTLLLTMMPGCPVSPEDLLAVTRAGIHVVVASIPAHV